MWKPDAGQPSVKFVDGGSMFRESGLSTASGQGVAPVDSRRRASTGNTEATDLKSSELISRNL